MVSISQLSILSHEEIDSNVKQTALFNFQSALLCLLLLICTCAYFHQLFPGIMDRNKEG
jgi:Protein of unknown function (DUF1242)